VVLSSATNIAVGQTVSAAKGIAAGMLHLHKHHSIVHRDLKPANILLDAHNTPLIADFGLSRLRDNSASAIEQSVMTQRCGTFKYMSPEVMRNEQYDEKTDTYAFGLILWEILTRSLPYKGLQAIQLYNYVVVRKMRPTIPPHVPQPMAALIAQCWDYDASARPSFERSVVQLQELEEKWTQLQKRASAAAASASNSEAKQEAAAAAAAVAVVDPRLALMKNAAPAPAAAAAFEAEKTIAAEDDDDVDATDADCSDGTVQHSDDDDEDDDTATVALPAAAAAAAAAEEVEAAPAEAKEAVAVDEDVEEDNEEEEAEVVVKVASPRRRGSSRSSDKKQAKTKPKTKPKKPTKSQQKKERGSGSGSGSGRAQTIDASTGKRVCFYGAKCYRTNPQHLRDYAHPQR
jgi:hypothetical protein